MSAWGITALTGCGDHSAVGRLIRQVQEEGGLHSLGATLTSATGRQNSSLWIQD